MTGAWATGKLGDRVFLKTDETRNAELTVDLKAMRRRLGWTQWDLAERLNVDQGTVSRWERGVETPRPASYAMLRDLILKGDGTRAMALSRAMVQHNLAPSCLCDSRHRLIAFSAKANRHYQERLGMTLTDQIGWELARHSEFVGNPEVWQAVKKAGLGREDLLLLRLTINLRGQGHVTRIEPIYEGGSFLGWSSTRTDTFDYPANDDVSLERLDVIHADQPELLATVYEGTRSRVS